MRRIIILLFIFFSIEANAQFMKDKAIYITHQPIDLGIGMRFDKRFQDDWGIYASGAWGNYRPCENVIIPNHVRVAVGVLRYKRQYHPNSMVHFGAGIIASRAGEPSNILIGMPEVALWPVSTEICVGMQFRIVAVGVRYDWIKNESCIDVGITFN